jgi:RecB family exonuclease
MPFQTSGIETINLKGIIDRIDEKDGTFRIVDYKTGKVKNAEFDYQNPEEILEKDNKEAFQTLFYSYIYSRANPGTNLKPYILPLKEVVKGYIEINRNYGKLSEESFVQFEEKLKSIILTILDPESPIVQTEDLNICAMCSYKNMCMR